MSRMRNVDADSDKEVDTEGIEDNEDVDTNDRSAWILICMSRMRNVDADSDEEVDTEGRNGRQ